MLRRATVGKAKRVGDRVEFEVVAITVHTDVERTHKSQHRYSAFADLHKALKPKVAALPVSFPVGKVTGVDVDKRAEELSKYMETVCGAIDASNPPEELMNFLHAAAVNEGAAPTELKLLTFNLGLLRLRMLGMTTFGSPPYTEERFQHIPDAIKACGADVIALQEIYEKVHVAALLKHVGSLYPYVARADNNKGVQFHNGLMFLSKYPIDSFSLKKHTHASALEKWFGCKSCLSCNISTPLGPLCLVNMHTTAGGGVDPEKADVDTVRESELAEAMQLADEAAAAGYTAAIIGDLNMGPEASAGNYRYMTSKGYDDAVLPFAEAVGCTWDPTSPLNNMQVFADCPPQRIDHFFFKQGGKFKARAAEKLFTDAPVSAGPKKAPKMVPLSDHYGLMITVQPDNDTDRL